MKKIFMALTLCLVSACSLFGEKEEQPVQPPKPPRELGEFIEGPCQLPSGVKCGMSGKGGCCLSDNACHSVKEKCLKR